MTKFKASDRIFIGLQALVCFLCAAAVGLLTYYRRELRLDVGEHAWVLPDHWSVAPIMVLIATALAFCGIRLLILAFANHAKFDKSSVAIQNAENGSVRVSVQAMDMLVKQAVAQTEGVADVKTRIENHEDSISVHVEMALNSDVYIPNTTMLMQHKIKSFIEEYSGIAVREVTIMVNKIMEVQPHPPLQIPEPKHNAVIIDQPDDEQALPEETIDDQSDDADVSDEPDVIEDADFVPLTGDAEEDDDSEDEDAPITEKDIW